MNDILVMMSYDLEGMKDVLDTVKEIYTFIILIF